MAIFRPGALIGGISGKSGGAVYALGPQSAQLRTRGQPNNAVTPRQNRQRNWYMRTTKAWRELTADERTAWEQHAASKTFPNRLGQHRPLTPRQTFFAFWLAQTPQAFPDPNIPPTAPQAGLPTITDYPNAGFFGSNAYGFIWTPAFDAGGIGNPPFPKATVEAAAPTATENPNAPVIQIYDGITDINSGFSLVLNIKDVYVNQFGFPPDGSWIRSRIRWTVQNAWPTPWLDITGQFNYI